MRSRKHIVIVGSSLAGYTAAIELKQKLRDGHEVTVISKSAQLLFTPSLTWVPFGLRTRDELSFEVGPALHMCGARFLHEEVTRLDLGRRIVTTKRGHERYDYLVIATGARANYAAIPGLGPRGYTQSIMSLPEAERAQAAFQRFVAAPGPVVVGSVRGATCLLPARAFLFSMACELRIRGLAERAPLTYLTAEPSLAQFGQDGLISAIEATEQFLDKLGIRSITNGAIQGISSGEIQLVDGRKLPFAYAMLVPPSLGVDLLRSCEEITNASGFVRVNDFGQTHALPEVFAAGVAAAGCNSSSEAMGKVVAHNVAAHIHGETMIGEAAAA